MLTISRYKRPLKVSALNPPNPYPRFRIQYDNIPIKAHESLTEADLEGFFYEGQKSILPYTPQDDFDRSQKESEIDCILMENDTMRIIIYPQYGGRVASIFSKTLNRELLFDNPTFQPANLALRNAWFSGGIEFNGPIYGHTMTSCDDVYCAQVETEKGPILRIYEFDRSLETTWQVDMYLDEDKFWMHPKVTNPNKHIIDYYWWTNLGVACSNDTRIISPSNDECIHHSPDQIISREPYPIANGNDISYPRNCYCSDSIFFDVPKNARPWIASVEAEGKAVVHTSSSILSGRKYFVWGNQNGGKHWLDFLALKGEGNYLEIQAGLVPTQLQTKPLAAGESFSWSECVMGIDVDAETVLKGSYSDAVKSTGNTLNRALSQADFDAMDAILTSYEELPVSRTFHYGSAWGALVEKRDNKTFSTALNFNGPITVEEQPWMELLSTGSFDLDALQHLGVGWCTTPKWKKVIEDAISTVEPTWLHYLFLGVMELESQEIEKAKACFEQSVTLQASAHAYRCLAIIKTLQKENGKELYFKAFDLSRDRYLAVEICQYLIEIEEWGAFIEFYRSLDEGSQQHERIQIALAHYSLEQKDYSTVEHILSHKFVYNRECETTLSDLWFELHYAYRENDLGRPLSEDEKKQVQLDSPPHIDIDFRMN